MQYSTNIFTSKNEIYWILENGVLTVNGQNKIPDYDCRANISAPWENVREQIAEIHIKEGITEIMIRIIPLSLGWNPFTMFHGVNPGGVISISRKTNCMLHLQEILKNWFYRNVFVY